MPFLSSFAYTASFTYTSTNIPYSNCLIRRATTYSHLINHNYCTNQTFTTPLGALAVSYCGCFVLDKPFLKIVKVKMFCADTNIASLQKQPLFRLDKPYILFTDWLAKKLSWFKITSDVGPFLPEHQIVLYICNSISPNTTTELTPCRINSESIKWNGGYHYGLTSGLVRGEG